MGDVLHGQQPVHISSPRQHPNLHHTHTDKTTLQTGEDTPASPCGVDTTRGATVTGYKPSRDWRKARRQGLLPTVGGILGSHWTAITRLKLGSPQTERCCPATVCYPHWVQGIRNHPKSSSQLAHQATKEKHEKRPALKLEKRPALKLGTWNVRTMLTGISENLHDVSDSRKTAVINNELLRLNVDIATLQETRLADSGALKEKDYTFYWQGKGSGEHREYGVGFAVRNSVLSMIEPGSDGSERLLTLLLNSTAGPVTLVSVYAPTLSATSDIKDEFYENLAAIISSVPNNEQLVLMGDFNARAGADHDMWPSCLGQFGMGKMNENGQRLLELCTYHDLCLANSYFRTKPQHKVSWRHPRSKHWHQLDLILFRRAALKNDLHIRSYHSADYNTDHYLVCCKIRLQPKRFHRTKKQGNPHIEVSKM